VKWPWAGRWRRWQALRTPAAPRVELNQRRIFIFPNRSGAGFFVLLLLIFLAAINYQNSMAYALVFLLGSLFTVAILQTYRNLASLVVSSTGAVPVFVGEHALLTVRLESTGREHQAIGLGWSGAALVSVDVTAHHVEQVQLSLPTLTRGWLQVPRVRVQSHFPLGMLTAWTWLDLAQRVRVYPQPLPGPMPRSAGTASEPDAALQRQPGQGVDDFQGLKLYQPGDSWRRLNWKAFSRGEALLIKDFADLRSEPLCLDFLALGGDVEQRLSRLCHWVLKLSRQQRPFMLRLPGVQLDFASGDIHRLACLRALALHGHRR